MGIVIIIVAQRHTDETPELIRKNGDVDVAINAGFLLILLTRGEKVRTSA